MDSNKHIRLIECGRNFSSKHFNGGKGEKRINRKKKDVTIVEDGKSKEKVLFFPFFYRWNSMMWTKFNSLKRTQKFVVTFKAKWAKRRSHPTKNQVKGYLRPGIMT